MNKSLSYLLILLGVLLILAAILLITVIVPNQRVFPADVDTVRVFDVEYLTLLNPETLEFFVAEAGEAEDVKIERHIKVQDVVGDSALIWEGQTIVSGEELLNGVEFYYALDRQSLEPVENMPTDWQSLDGLWDRDGLVLGWGVMGVEKRTYTGWNEDTRQTVELNYVGEDTVNGMPAYVFTSHSDPQPIHPDQVEVLGLLPELSIEQVASLARGMEVDDPAMGVLLNVALPGLLENAVRSTQNIPLDQEEVMVPLEFYYDYDGRYWVEPTTGVLLNTIKYEHRAATFPPEILANLETAVENLGMDPAIISDLLPVTVSEFQYTGSHSAIEGATADARNGIDRLRFYGTTLPLVLSVLGGLLILAGIVLHLRARAPLVSQR